MPASTAADERITKIANWGNLSDREHLRVSLEQVKKNFERFGLLDEQVKFLKGWFHRLCPLRPLIS